jgi:hypothetical protein
MVHECQHVYETGRKCRRIPKRGETLCPGHRPHPTRSHHDQPDFASRLLSYAQQLRGLGLEALFGTLQDSLACIQPIVESKSSRATYEPFARAYVAVSVVMEQLENLRSSAINASRAAEPFAAPPRPAPPNPAVSYASPPSTREIR